MSEINEKIACAAIHHAESGVTISLPRPARHGDVQQAAYRLIKRAIGGDWDQGFLTTMGKYVTREVALDIAEVHGQIVSKSGGPGSNQLFSEDCW